MSEEADPLYRPLGGPASWAEVPVDEAAWDEALDRVRAARLHDPAWAAMVRRGMLLAAAHQSGALDGLYPPDPELVLSLLRGEASPGSIDEAARAHVRANAAALRLARDLDVSEESIRRLHDVACRPQLTHRVRVDDRIQDHVLATGDYKHHPNHILDPTGSWRATAPVAQVPGEMAALVAHVRSTPFAELHPAAKAAYLLHALDHVQPFADGNGRVGRALAGGCLLRAAAIPFLVLSPGALPLAPRALVDFVPRAAIGLIDLLVSARSDSPALDRWRAREAMADAVRRRLVPAVAEALDRYGQRPDRRADLSTAVVTPGEAVTIRVPIPRVEETITVEAHPDEGEGPVVLAAVEAGLRHEATSAAPLDPWLDRVASTLALRIAAELE